VGDDAAAAAAIDQAMFSACREEILARSAHQHTLISINLTALAAVAGVVLSGHADKRLLLLLPLLSSSIGLLWYDHARNIDSLGDYVRERLPEGFTGYERYIAELERKERRRVPMTFALLMLFVATPIAGLVVPIHRVEGALWLLWGVGLLLGVTCAIALLTWMLRGFGGEPEGAGERPDAVGGEPEGAGERPDAVGGEPEGAGERPDAVGAEPEGAGGGPDGVD
jgi:hypothetical protein